MSKMKIFWVFFFLKKKKKIILKENFKKIYHPGLNLNKLSGVMAKQL